MKTCTCNTVQYKQIQNIHCDTRKTTNGYEYTIHSTITEVKVEVGWYKMWLCWVSSLQSGDWMTEIDNAAPIPER